MKMSIARLALIALMVIVTTACGRLGQRVDSKIESTGSELTGVSVKVHRVKLKLGRGLGEITGLTVANPEGYEADYAVQMERLHLNLGVVSLLRRKPLVLDELVIDSPIVNFERNDQGGSNLKEISDNVRENLEQIDRKSAEDEPAAEDQPAADDTPEKPLRIAVHRLVIEGVTFNMRGVDGTTISGTLPTIELSDVGGSEGETGGGLGKVVILAMAREMFKKVVARNISGNGEGVQLALETLDPERMLESLGQKLTLTDAQLDRIRPVIEQQSDNLQNAIEEVLAQGFVDRESLSRRFTAAADEARTQLEDTLTDEQMEKLEALFEELDQLALEDVRDAIVDKLTTFLELNEGQLDTLRPILRDELRKRSELLSRFANAPELSIDEFRVAYEALQDETRQRLSEVLDPTRMKALTERQEQLRKLIREAYFGIVEQ